MPEKTTAMVLEKHSDRLLSFSGVMGIAEGICDGEPCIKVFVERGHGGEVGMIPSQVDGIPVVVELTGKFEASKR